MYQRDDALQPCTLLLFNGKATEAGGNVRVRHGDNLILGGGSDIEHLKVGNRQHRAGLESLPPSGPSSKLRATRRARVATTNPAKAGRTLGAKSTKSRLCR